MFRKIREFYKRNRIYSILMIISTLCVVSIAVGVVLYFVGQTNKDKYGNRLEGIENVSISDKKLDDIETKIKEDELVKEVNINTSGKLIYVLITLNTGIHADSESISQSSLELFDEKIKNYYDIQYIVSNEDKTIPDNFPVMGYLKSGNSVIKWTNYFVNDAGTEGDANEE